MSSEDVSILEPKQKTWTITNLVKGYFDNIELLSSREFYFPMYLITFTNMKKGTKRYLLLNGITGEDIDFDGLGDIT